MTLFKVILNMADAKSVAQGDHNHALAEIVASAIGNGRMLIDLLEADSWSFDPESSSYTLHNDMMRPVAVYNSKQLMSISPLLPPGEAHAKMADELISGTDTETLVKALHLRGWNVSSPFASSTYRKETPPAPAPGDVPQDVKAAALS